MTTGQALVKAPSSTRFSMCRYYADYLDTDWSPAVVVEHLATATICQPGLDSIETRDRAFQLQKALAVTIWSIFIRNVASFWQAYGGSAHQVVAPTLCLFMVCRYQKYGLAVSNVFPDLLFHLSKEYQEYGKVHLCDRWCRLFCW